MMEMEKILTLTKENRRILPGIAIIGTLVFVLVLKWGYNTHQSSVAEITAYNDLLQTSSAIASRGEGVKKLIAEQKTEIGTLEKGLLKAEKPSIAAAQLQEAFKKIVARKKIIISSENVLNFEDAGKYIRIPVEFHLQAELSQLTRLLYEIQLSPLLMGVRSMNIRSMNATNSSRMSVTLVLEGAIKNTGVSR